MPTGVARDRAEGEDRPDVEVYGAITLRTDGGDLVIAFHIEKQGTSPRRWQTYTFRHDPVDGFVPAR